MDQASDWDYCFCQIINSDSDKDVFPNGTLLAKPPYSGLDTQFPMHSICPTTGIFDGDSPSNVIAYGSNMAGYNGIQSSNVSFTTWLMCRPAYVPGDWVPLSNLDWSFSETATWLKGKDSPKLIASQVKPAPLTPTAFSDTTEFPRWFQKVVFQAYTWKKK